MEPKPESPPGIPRTQQPYERASTSRSSTQEAHRRDREGQESKGRVEKWIKGRGNKDAVGFKTAGTVHSCHVQARETFELGAWEETVIYTKSKTRAFKNTLYLQRGFSFSTRPSISPSSPLNAQLSPRPRLPLPLSPPCRPVVFSRFPSA